MATEGQPLRRSVVLVVDDDRDTLDSVACVIRDLLGCTVLTASSGDEALRIIDANVHVDLLFADIMMPRMDGLTLTRLARNQRAELPVVLTTGLPEAVELALQCGAMALIKPYSPEQLEAVFTEQLLIQRRAALSLSPFARQTR